MRLLFVSIEFSAGTFSGNGVYAKSQVRGLARLGHEVFVVAGKPLAHGEKPSTEGACGLFEVPLTQWGTLDRSCAWEEFAYGASNPALISAVSQFQPAAILGVDWTSLPALQCVAAGLASQGASTPPYIYMNYRVFHRSVPVQDQDFMFCAESKAIEAAAGITVLSRSDREYLIKVLGIEEATRPFRVLLPPLRSDLEAIPLPADVSDGMKKGCAAGCNSNCQKLATQPAGCAPVRHLLTCCVRLSEEKHPDLFVSIVECLAREGLLQRLQITPFFSASATTPYAEALKQRLRQAAPSSIIEQHFLGPAELAAVFAKTRLNIHPCLYDAFGMTIVEAASQGAPSLVNHGGTVGATDLLQSANKEVFEADLSVKPASLAAYVAGLLANEELLRTIGRAAATRAREWTEVANAKALADLVGNIASQPASAQM